MDLLLEEVFTESIFFPTSMIIFNTYGGLLVRKQCHNVDGMKSRNWHAGTETLHPDTKFAPPPTYAPFPHADNQREKRSNDFKQITS